MKFGNGTVFFGVLLFLHELNANPITNIYQKITSEPAEFLFDSLLVILLLIFGGILAGISQSFRPFILNFQDLQLG